jgi:hypothetical protein
MSTFLFPVRAVQSIAALAIGVVCGCGPSAPFSIVPVTGKVTYEDGEPIKAHRVTISFESEAPPVDAKTHPRAGRAEVKPDGTFDNVTTWKANDGAIVGPHKVVIITTDEKQNITKDIPKEYTSKLTTPLKADVQAGGPPLEFKIPRPGK